MKKTVAIVLAGVLYAQDFGPGRRVLLDAHNCYPEHGDWTERLQTALSTGLPVAIEQDLAWVQGRSVLSHDKQPTGKEPGLKGYFFSAIRPHVESALRGGDKKQWPLIVLNLDFKTDEPEHHQAVWDLLGEFEGWLTTSKKSSDPCEVVPLKVGPVLVLTGASDVQEKLFYEAVPDGGRLRLFGAVQAKADPELPPGQLITGHPGNYRRWWNNPWSVIERGGQRKSGEWAPADQERLKDVVDHAHKLGLWIRFYTLNGHHPDQGQGWTPTYNFGSLDAARIRWRAAAAAGADFIATDQYTEAASQIRSR